jgi:hypothetical protein
MFGSVKHDHAEIPFASPDRFFEAIRSIVVQIPIDTLHQVFDHRPERLDWITKGNGEYYSSPTHWLIYFLAPGTGE